jgi:hypothetical protein
MASDLKNLGDLAGYNKYLTDSGSLERFSSSVNSFWSNYYRVPTAFPATTVNAAGQIISGSSTVGPLYLGALPGCPDANTVGKGIPQRLPGYATTTPSMPVGMCRFFSDDALEYIAAQDRTNGSVRATYQFSPQLTGYVDLMVSRTETREKLSPYGLTASLVRSVAPTVATWPLLNGTFKSQNAIILPSRPPGQPDQRHRHGPAGCQAAVPLRGHSPTEPAGPLRHPSGGRPRGLLGALDFDAAAMYSKQDNKAVRTEPHPLVPAECGHRLGQLPLRQDQRRRGDRLGVHGRGRHRQLEHPGHRRARQPRRVQAGRRHGLPWRGCGTPARETGVDPRRQLPVR